MTDPTNPLHDHDELRVENDRLREFIEHQDDLIELQRLQTRDEAGAHIQFYEVLKYSVSIDDARGVTHYNFVVQGPGGQSEIHWVTRGPMGVGQIGAVLTMPLER